MWSPGLSPFLVPKNDGVKHRHVLILFGQMLWRLFLNGFNTSHFLQIGCSGVNERTSLVEEDPIVLAEARGIIVPAIA